MNIKLTKSELNTIRFCAEETGLPYQQLLSKVYNLFNYYEKAKEKELANIKTIATITFEEIKQLRREICLGSCFLGDYENSLEIDENDVYNFFEGYCSFLEDEAYYYEEENGEEKDAFEFDNDDTLEQWYYCVEYSEETINELKKPKIEEINEKYDIEYLRERLFECEEVYDLAYSTINEMIEDLVA